MSQFGLIVGGRAALVPCFGKLARGGEQELGQYAIDEYVPRGYAAVFVAFEGQAGWKIKRIVSDVFGLV